MRCFVLPAYRVGWVLLFLAAVQTAVAAPDMAPSRVFTGKDVFALQWVEDPQVRPDGHAVAYVRMSIFCD